MKVVHITSIAIPHFSWQQSVYRSDNVSNLYRQQYFSYGYCVTETQFHFICTDLDTVVIMPGTPELKFVLELCFHLFFSGLNLVNFSPSAASLSLLIKYTPCREEVNTN